jgi:hypothetical protein
MHISVRTPPIVPCLLAFCATVIACIVPGSASAAPGPSPVAAEALPIGSWDILANGSKGVLHVASVDEQGKFVGSVFGKPIKGFWDGFSRRVTFTTTDASSELQVYTGHPLASQPDNHLLAGTLEAFSGTGATANRNVYAWLTTDYTLALPGVVKRSVTYTSLAPVSLSIDANGFKGKLTIASVDAQDNVTGTVMGTGMQGLWDGYQRKLTFIRFEDMVDASRLQIYTGYLIPGYSTAFAGSFEAFTAATAQRNVFGWYATGPNIAPMPAPGPQEIFR